MNDYFATDTIQHQMALLRFMQSAKGRVVLDMQREVLAKDYTGKLPRDGEFTLQVHQRALHTGTPFFWGGAICKLLEATAPTIPNWTLTAEQLPCRSGFWWFEKPLILPGWEGGDINEPITAMSWVHVYELPEDAAPAGSVVFMGEGEHNYPVRVYVTAFTRFQGVNRPHGIPTTTVPWREGASLADLINSRETATIGNMERWSMKLRYFAAAMTFINQRILTTRAQSIPRHIQRQAARVLQHSPSVQVIELRAREHHYTERDGEPQARDWSHQWFVRGHWRQQWYPSLGTHQPKWIAPYVKGPDDKPLKAPSAQVFAVVR